MTVISLHQPRQELVVLLWGAEQLPFCLKPLRMETWQQGATGKSGLWLAGEAQSPGDACSSGAGRGTGGKFLVHGTLGLCILLRALQHPHLSPSVSQAWVL